MMPALRNVVREAGSDQPNYNVRAMLTLVSHSRGRQRFPMLLLVAFAMLALLLAVSIMFIGAAGLASYFPGRRAASLNPNAALRQD
jgi:ABC-type lipoprotein release transport system permease subunit